MTIKSNRKSFASMIWLLCAILLLVPFLGSFPEKALAAPTELYASPTGSGTTCSLAAPCSLTGARNKANNLNGNMSGNLIVYLRGGTYSLSDTFTLGTSDSGTNGYSVIYQNYPGETPILSGGESITGWTLHDATKNIYKASVGTSEFRQLYVADSRAVRARVPNMTNSDTGGPYYTALTTSSPYKVNASVIDNWKNMNQVEFVYLGHWRQKRARISSYSVTGTEASLTFLPSENGGLTSSFSQTPTYYYFENAYELLDAEGEWYLDTSTPDHTLYYKPRSGETMSSVQVVAPKVEKLVQIAGTSDTALAHHIQLRGITFEYSNWTHPSGNGYFQTQAGLPMDIDEVPVVPGAVQISNASNIRFEGNTVKWTGGHGLLVTEKSETNAIVGNTFQDLSAGGIYVFTDESSNDLISSNLVEKVGRDYMDTVGILAAQPDHMSIEFNEVRNMPYTGISIGWRWTDVDTGTAYDTVQYNKIHDVMQLLDDGGGIYSLGYMPYSIFENNYIYSLAASSYSGGFPIVGIYLDGGSTSKLVQKNVLDGTTKAVFAYNPPNRNNTIQYNYYNVPLASISSENTVSNNSNDMMSLEATTIKSGAGLVTNQALSYTSVSASSSYTGYTPAKAVNGSTDEPGWSSAGLSGETPWWQIDLGTPYRIRKIEIVSRLGTINYPSTRRNFEIWASNNSAMASGHVVIGSMGSDGFIHQTTWSAIITNTNAYRYIAIVKTEPENNFYLNEVRIYR